MKQFKDFEKNLQSLDEIVLSLESGELSLSEALSAFEKGITLFNTCHEAINQVEEKVKILVDDLETGEKKAVLFEEDEA